PNDRLGVEFNSTGRLGIPVLDELGVPRDADFYLCGPSAFLKDLSAGLATCGVAIDRVHTEIFGPGESITPGISAAPAHPVHAPIGPAGQALRCRSHEAASLSDGTQNITISSS